jgi:hypothetical protein
MLISTSSKQHLVEVKSLYTLNLDLDMNIKKFAAATQYCADNNLTFWVFCYVGRTGLIKVKNPTKVKDLKQAGIL